jgi:hypothetical protein
MLMAVPKGKMTRGRVLLIALGLIALGLFQTLNARQRHDRAAGMATASGMIALMSGVGIGIYGLQLKNRE